MKVVITIPAFNEAGSIGRVIDGIKAAMEGENYQILVVDDGSGDDTVRVAEEVGAVVFPHPRRMGLAQTFRTEMEKCLELGADTIVHIDADGQYQPEEIPKLLGGVREGYDLVLGSRYKGTIEYMIPIKRYGNIVLSGLVSIIAGKKLSDTQTGFRAFTREVAENVTINTDYTYTQEQVIKAARKNMKIKEVPIYFAVRKGESRLMRNPFEYMVKVGISLLKIVRGLVFKSG